MKPLREQVDSFAAFNEGLIEDTDVPVILGRLQFQLQNYESKIDSQLKKCSQLRHDIKIKEKSYDTFNLEQKQVLKSDWMKNTSISRMSLYNRPMGFNSKEFKQSVSRLNDRIKTEQ